MDDTHEMGQSSVFPTDYTILNVPDILNQRSAPNLPEILFFIVAFVLEITGAIAGFGSSTIFLPLALFFVDFQTALILVAISHLFGNLGRISFFKQGLDKKIIATFGIPSILFSFLGASMERGR
jgi:hypothetical protein